MGRGKKKKDEEAAAAAAAAAAEDDDDDEEPEDLMGDQSWAKTDNFSGELDDMFGDLLGDMATMKADAEAAGVDINAKMKGIGDDAAEAEAEDQKKAEEEAAAAAADAEKEKLEALKVAALRWQQAQVIRSYLLAMENRAVGGFGVNEKQRAYLLWARAKADWLDPLVAAPDPLLDQEIRIPY